MEAANFTKISTLLKVFEDQFNELWSQDWYMKPESGKKSDSVVYESLMKRSIVKWSEMTRWPEDTLRLNIAILSDINDQRSCQSLANHLAQENLIELLPEEASLYAMFLLGMYRYELEATESSGLRRPFTKLDVEKYLESEDANKICPDCSSSVHVRVRTCECGFVFPIKSKKKKEVEPSRDAQYVFNGWKKYLQEPEKLNAVYALRS